MKCLLTADNLTNQNPVKAAMFRTLYSQVDLSRHYGNVFDDVMSGVGPIASILHITS